MYVQNEIFAFSVFIVGVVAVFAYLYFQEQLRKKKASQQLLGNSD
jgi:preprotein translocase subunit YajC